jgi:hypothetical protein
VWKVDLTNNGSLTKFSQSSYLNVSSSNYALGNAQSIAVDPSSRAIAPK